MKDAIAVRNRLHQLGAHNLVWGKPERDELPKILMADEEIEHILNGRYSGGFATLVATNLRLLLVDKKVFFLTVEDIRYDMIAEVDYGHQFIGATIHVRSFSKDFKFQAIKKDELRDFTHFIQHRVMALRGHQTGQNKIADLPVRGRAIPMQIFEETDELTDDQANSLVPVSRENWNRVKHGGLVNPYAQTPLTTRRRVGPYSFANR